MWSILVSSDGYRERRKGGQVLCFKSEMWRPKAWIKGTVWYKFSDGRYWHKQQRIRTESLLETKVAALGVSLQFPLQLFSSLSWCVCVCVRVLCIPKRRLFFFWIPHTYSAANRTQICSDIFTFSLGSEMSLDNGKAKLRLWTRASSW